MDKNTRHLSTATLTLPSIDLSMALGTYFRKLYSDFLGISNGTKELYSEILKNSIKKYSSERNTRTKSIESEINKTTQLIDNADERLLNKDIGIETYNRMNDKYQSQLRSLKAEQSELKT